MTLENTGVQMFYPNSMKKEHMKSVAIQQQVARNTYRISQLGEEDMSLKDKVLWQKSAHHDYIVARGGYQKMLNMWKDNDVDTL